jgi:hypothetical protein
VTPTSTGPSLRPRRPRHRADAASRLAVRIFVRVRPRPPTSELVGDRSVKVTWWYEHQEALGSRWCGDAHLTDQLSSTPTVPVTGPVPRVSPRCGASSADRVLCHLRRTGCDPGPGSPPANRPRLGASRLPPRQNRRKTRDPRLLRRAGWDAVPPWVRQSRSRAEARVRASRWYEHQEALERGGWVTPPSIRPDLRPRRPRHRADAASSLAVWIIVPVRPRPPIDRADGRSED